MSGRGWWDWPRRLPGGQERINAPGGNAPGGNGQGRRTNDRTLLVKPSAMATASNVPDSPCVSDPAQPWLLAPRFHDTATSCGTPCVKRTGWADAGCDGLHAAESHTTWPWRVTTTRAADGPNGISHPDEEVDTA